MYHIKNKVTSFHEVKKSKFYGILLPIDNEERIKDEINIIKKEYPNASHYCYGAVINGNYRSNDDGEPSSTAGKPILEVLVGNQLDNVLCVVVRYFGGTLLGTGGLVKAYSTAAKEATALAQITTPTIVYNYQLTVGYNFTSKIEFFLKNNATIMQRDYQQDVIYYYQSLTDLSQQLSEITAGSAINTLLSTSIVEM